MRQCALSSLIRYSLIYKTLHILRSWRDNAEGGGRRNLRWIHTERVWEGEGSQLGLCHKGTVEVTGEGGGRTFEKLWDGGQALGSHWVVLGLYVEGSFIPPMSFCVNANILLINLWKRGTYKEEHKNNSPRRPSRPMDRFVFWEMSRMGRWERQRLGWKGLVFLTWTPPLPSTPTQTIHYATRTW